MATNKLRIFGSNCDLPGSSNNKDLTERLADCEKRIKFAKELLAVFRAEKKAYSTAAIAKEGQIEKMLQVFNEEKEKKEKLTRRQQVAKKRQAEEPDNREAKAN